MHHCVQVQHMRLVRYVLPRPLWPRGAAGARLQPPHLRVSAAAAPASHSHGACACSFTAHCALRMDGGWAVVRRVMSCHAPRAATALPCPALQHAVPSDALRVHQLPPLQAAPGHGESGAAASNPMRLHGRLRVYHACLHANRLASRSCSGGMPAAAQSGALMLVRSVAWAWAGRGAASLAGAG